MRKQTKRNEQALTELEKALKEVEDFYKQNIKENFNFKSPPSEPPDSHNLKMRLKYLNALPYLTSAQIQYYQARIELLDRLCSALHLEIASRALL